MDQQAIQHDFELALREHQAGRLQQAEQLFRQVLARHPEHATALHHLGLIAHQAGRNETAIEFIRRAIALRPSYAEAHYNLGVVLKSNGLSGEAVHAFQQAIALRPNYAEAYGNLGLALHNTGRLDEAIAAYRRAIALRPNLPEAHYNLGSALKDDGQPEAALAAYNRAIALRPPDAQALRSIGLALQEMGRLDEAIAAYRQAIALGPADAQTLSSLGVALRGKGRLDEAVEALRAAIALQPGSAEALSNLGNALGDQRQFDDAIAAYRKAIALRPNCAEAYSNMGNALEANGQLDEAVAACSKAISLKPDLAEPHNILGNALHNQGRLDEAIAAYRRALALKPEYPEAHFGLASSLLMRGDFPQGWEEYEWRWKCRDFPSPKRSLAGLQWDGGPLENRTLLLHAEQGLGDAIQFIRYVPWAARRGGKVIVECQPELQRLLGTVAEKCRIVPRGSALPDHDWHCPLASLPRIFRTNWGAIPAEVPYLHPEPHLLDSWRPKVIDPAAPPAGLKVALAWAGNPTFKYDRSRSMSLDRLAALAQVSGVSFFSVQKGHAAPQAQTPPPGLRLVNLAPELHDFADTAAVLSMVDLVITTDTSVAHLAGALGRPVWVMLQFVPDWRWLTQREDSPWYPSMRLFRQPARGDWAAVIKRVADELSSLAIGRGNQVAIPSALLKLWPGENKE